MRFKNLKGKPILLRGMHTYPNQVVSSHSMRSILRHGYIEWYFRCLIKSPKYHFNISKNPKDIDQLLSKYENVFGDLPLGIPLDKGVEHVIELDIRTQSIKIQPYRHPKRIQDNI